MRSVPSVDLRCALFLALLGVTPFVAGQAQRVDPPTQILRDPSRTRDLRVSAAATGPKPAIQLFLTPSETFTTGFNSSLQIKATRSFTSADLSIYGAYSHIDRRPGTFHRVKAGVSLDPSLAALHEKLSLSIGGEAAQTVDASTDLGAFAELDIALFSSLTLGGIAYYDSSDPEGGTSTSGATFGVVGLWTAPNQQTRLLAEYDFKSDFNGEDAFAAKLVQPLGTMFGGRSTQVIVGAGKHRVITAALKIWMRK